MISGVAYRLRFREKTTWGGKLGGKTLRAETERAKETRGKTRAKSAAAKAFARLKPAQSPKARGEKKPIAKKKAKNIME